MSKLLPRLFAVILAIGCCSPGWAQLTISPGCSDQTVQCTAALDTVMCPIDPVAYQGDDELLEPCGTAECILASEKQSKRVSNTATTAVPINGADAGALVLYNIQAFGVTSQYYVPKPGVGLTLDQYEPLFPGDKGIAILHGVVQGVADASEQWEIFAVYEGETSGADWQGAGGGLKYEHDCLSTVNATGDDWQIYTMNGGMSFLEGQGSLSGSLLTLSHAPANNYFGFQVGEGANDRNCEYGAGGWFGWEGTISGQPAAGAMGDVLVNLDPAQDCYEACDAQVTCFCIATDEDDNIFEVFECVTSREDDTPPVMTNAPGNISIACTDELPAPPTPVLTDNCTDVCAPIWELTPYLDAAADVCDQACDIQLPFLVSYSQSAFTCTGNSADEYPSENCQGCGYYTRTWIIEDDCGNQNTHTQTITIVDDVAPTWNNPAEVEYRFESCLVILTKDEAEDPSLVPVYASDACDDSLTYEITATELSGGCPLTWHRMWTAKDDCGNVSNTFHQYVQLKDEVAPVVTAPFNTTIYLDASCSTNDHPSITGTATSTDHCSTQERLDTMMTYTDVINPVTCLSGDTLNQGSYTITRTWTTTDYCLNTGSDVQTITVLDTIAPDGEVHDVVLDCGAFDCETEYTDNGLPTATDNCDSQIDNSWVNLHCVTFTYTVDMFAALDNSAANLMLDGQIINSISFPGAVSGDVYTQTLMLEPGDYTIELTDPEYGNGWTDVNEGGNVDGTEALTVFYETLEMETAIEVDFTDGFSTSQAIPLDECGSRCGPEHPQYESSPEGEEYCYFRERKYTFVDDCGNSSSEIQRIYLNDNEAPTFDGDNAVELACDLYNEQDGFGGVLGLTNVTDNCAHDDDITITFVDVEMSAGCAGMYERTYTLADECGNEVTFVQFVTLTDNEAPQFTITCPATADIYVDSYCEENRSESETGTPTVHGLTDNCDPNVYVSMTYVDGAETGVCPGEYTFTRTWTVMGLDHCYNFTTLTCEQTINVHDDIAPAQPGIVCPADADIYLDADCYADSSPQTTGEAAALSSDNCALDSVYVWSVDGEREYTCEPDSGNSFALSASLGALESATASLSDDLVAVGLHIDLNWSSLGCTEWASDLTMEITSPNGECVVISGFASEAPNAACEQHSYPVSWNTTTPGNFVLDLMFDEHISGSGAWTLEVTENWDGACGVDFDLDLTLLRRAEGDYNFTRTWYAQAEDCVGNQSTIASCNQLISAHDEIAPTFDLELSASTYSVACDQYEEGVVYDVFATDNCDSNVKVEVLYNEDCDGDMDHGFDNDEVSGSCAGSFIRTYLATDDCGNTSTFEQYIALTDDEAPVVTLDCPADITINKDENCFANDTRSGAGEATYEVTDNCSIDSTCVHVTDSEPVYTCEEVEHSYYFTRTWEVEAWDDCGNHASETCEQLITVVDNSAPAKPIINCPGDVVRHRDANCDTDLRPHIADGCGGTGVLTIDYPLTSDHTGPVLEVDHDQIPDGVDVHDCIDDPAITTSYYDNCSDDADLITVIDYTDTPVGDVNCTHYIERAWTAYFIDECGNQSETATCTQIINIIDDLDPQIHLDDIVYVDCEVFHANPDSIFASASDNCDPNVTLTLIDQDMIMPGTCAGLFYNTYRATDCSGNQFTTSHYVELVDDVAPDFLTFPADTVVQCGGGTTPSDLGMPTFADNCSETETLVLEHSDSVSTFKDEDCQTIERHWTITDPCGNSYTQIQEYEIEDSSYPVITTPACDHTAQCDGEGNLDQFNNWLATHAGAEATDDCSSLIWDYEVPVISAGTNPQLSDGCGATGEVTVTFYATDACGNSTPTTATFTVVDTLAPDLTNIILPDSITLEQTPGCDRSTGVNVTGIPSADADNGADACCYAFVDISHEDGAIVCLCEPDDSDWFVPQFTEDQLFTYCETEAEIAGTVSFDWDYNTDDLGGAEWDVAVVVDGLLIDQFGADEQSGSYSVEVGAGETIGFGIMSEDGLVGGASLLISNFSGPSGMDFIGIYDEANWDQYDGYNGSHTFSNDGETLLIEGTNVDFECEGSYAFIRTWTLFAFDECGNESETLVYDQVITVIDNIAPQFTETCGNDNGEEIAVDYDSPFGDCTIPAPCPVEAEDNCDADVSITCTVDTLGEFAPRGNVKNYSLATTPTAYAAGETCNSMDPHALRLMNLPNDDMLYTMTEASLMTEYDNGEIMLTCSLASSNPLMDAGWILHLALMPEATAIQLQAEGPDGIIGTADDGIASHICLNDVNFLGNMDDLVSCGNLGLPSSPNFSKFVVDCRDGADGLPKSRLIGIDGYGGSELALRHQPANSFFGFQIGVGANQQNAEFGMSGWFFWEGHFLGQNVTGSGDFFCDLDCTLPWGIQHCCTAVDDCGNESEFCYTYSITGETDSGDDPVVSGGSNGDDHTPVVIGGAGDVTTGKTPIRVTNLQPNPTNDVSQLGFVVAENMRIRVDLIAMDGVLVAELYDGIAQSGVNHTLDVEANGLSNGMYQIRLSSNDYLVVKKLLVSE